MEINKITLYKNNIGESICQYYLSCCWPPAASLGQSKKKYIDKWCNFTADDYSRFEFGLFVRDRIVALESIKLEDGSNQPQPGYLHICGND